MEPALTHPTGDLSAAEARRRLPFLAASPDPRAAIRETHASPARAFAIDRASLSAAWIEAEPARWPSLDPSLPLRGWIGRCASQTFVVVWCGETLAPDPSLRAVLGGLRTLQRAIEPDAIVLSSRGALLGTHGSMCDPPVPSVDLDQLQRRLRAAKCTLREQPVAHLVALQTPHGPLRVSVTDRLRGKARRARVWGSAGMRTALKNAAYGFDPRAPRSRSGRDGIFLVDRHVRPPNAMVNKLFDRFLDRPDPLVRVLEETLGPAAGWTPVRLVSHHLRLLGVLSAGHLVLVDVDAR